MPGLSSREVTLLWAMRSRCDLGCRYCYFGTVEEHAAGGVPAEPGRLSHLSREDLSLADVLAFVSTLAGSPVQRIFLAGGEPLIWPPVLDVIEAIKNNGVDVVVCTNGIRLNQSGIAARIIGLGVDAVSVSLDSVDPAANDRYRPSRHNAHGWRDVVSGIRCLLADRGTGQSPRVGVYTVVTRQNLSHVHQMGVFAAELGCDYYVPQPVSLAASHPLHAELSLTEADRAAIASVLDQLYSARLPLALPDRSYARRFVASITAATGRVPDCFGGRELFFIEPDGSVWDCPSSLKIAATSPERRRTIRGNTATGLFATGPRCTDCSLFSRDCVNMWPLMGFGGFALRPGDRR
ncbi:MAG TPA: radical SAM protein [Streptosporangiaceae bacterium]